jgi:predicted Zn finger-like uncharacterized protein
MNVSCPQCSTIYRVDPAKVPPGGVRARCSTCSGIIPVGMRTPTPARASGPVDAIGAAFGDRPTPPPFVPSRPQRPATPARQTPVTPQRTPAAPQRAAPETQRRATPPSPARVATPPSSPRVSTPPSSPRAGTPAASVPQLGASLPPLRPTPRAPWSPVTTPPARAATPPVSVPAVTPPPAAATALPAMPQDSSSQPSVENPAPAASRRPINPFLSRDPSLRAKRLARALVSDMVAYYPAKHAEGLEKGTLKELFRDEIKKSYDEYVGQVGADFARTTTHFQESLNEVLGAGKKIF